MVSAWEFDGCNFWILAQIINFRNNVMGTETQTITYDKNNPFLATLKERRDLTSTGSAKETVHFVVDIAGSGLTYTCGDSLGVYPTNRPDMVERLLAALGFSGEEPVVLPRTEQAISLHLALFGQLSIAQPTKKFLQTLRAKVTDEVQQGRLDELLAPDNSDALRLYLEHREFLDLAEEYPSAVWQAQEYVEQLRKLVPRLYSIASSPLLYPDEIHLTVAVVRYQTNDRERHGVASTYLSDRIGLGVPTIPVFVARSHFGLPEDPQTDLIMVGPGTGVAPFRSFIQERSASGASGRSWLFFGDQHRSTDFLYEEEWQKYLTDGVLTRFDTAFSRDQATKVYVQDRMLENAAELWLWIEGGARFYVCGDAKRMAKDVDTALHEIIREQGGLSEEDAVAYVKQMKKDKRYQRDVY